MNGRRILGKCGSEAYIGKVGTDVTARGGTANTTVGLAGLALREGRHTLSCGRVSTA